MNSDPESNDCISPSSSPKTTEITSQESPYTPPPTEPTRISILTNQSAIDRSKKPVTSTRWRRTFSSLSNTNFQRYWLGMLFKMGGTTMQMMVRAYLVYDITGSAKILGIVSASSSLPLLGLCLFGGAIADRMDRKKIIQIGQWMTMGLTLFVGVSISTGTITWYHLLVSGILQGAIWSFMGPARQAMIPEVVRKDQVTNAVALNASGMSIMTVAAPAVAGILYALIGPDGVYYVISALLFGAILLTSTITTTNAKTPGHKSQMFAEIKEGISYIKKNNLVLVLLIVGLVTVMLATPFRFLLPVFVVDIYLRESGAMGLLLSMIGLGSLAGSLFVASLGNRGRGRILIMACFASAVGLIIVAAIPSYITAVFIMLLLGLGEAGRRSLNQSLIMELVEDRYRGRVMSVFTMNFGLMPLGVLPAGIAMDLWGGQVAVAILGVLMLLTTLLIVTSQKTLRDLQ